MLQDHLDVGWDKVEIFNQIIQCRHFLLYYCRFFKYIKKWNAWASLRPDIKFIILDKIAELTWEVEAVNLDDQTPTIVPALVEVNEVQSSQPNLNGGFIKYVQYFVEPSARLKRGQLLLINGLKRKNVSSSKFKEMEECLKWERERVNKTKNRHWMCDWIELNWNWINLNYRSYLTFNLNNSLIPPKISRKEQKSNSWQLIYKQSSLWWCLHPSMKQESNAHTTQTLELSENYLV